MPRTKKIRGVTFDAEGVLFEFEREGHHAAHRLAAKDAGLELSHEEAVECIPNLCGGPSKLIAQQIHGLITSRGITPKLAPEEIQELSRRYFVELFYEIQTGERKIKPRPGFLETLAVLRDAGMNVMVGSSTWQEEFWVYWKKTGLDQVFRPEEIVLADEKSGIRHKPEPDIFLETAKRLGIDPAEQLVVEDSLRGVKAARAAESPVVGMTVYDVPWTIVPLYNEGALRVFCDWREVNFLSLIANLNGGTH